jgi:hypothetical protein
MGTERVGSFRFSSTSVAIGVISSDVFSIASRTARLWGGLVQQSVQIVASHDLTLVVRHQLFAHEGVLNNNTSNDWRSLLNDNEAELFEEGLCR